MLNELLKTESWLALPEEQQHGASSWFGYPIRIAPDSGISRDAVIRVLTERRIGTRLLFAGNIIRQPAYADVNYRTIGSLQNADTIMRDVFWVGTYPGLDDAHMRYLGESIQIAGRASEGEPAGSRK